MKINEGFSPDPVERMRKWEAEMMKEHGWISHQVPGDPAVPTEFNAHTHGLPESVGIPDLQLVVPLPKETISYIFWRVVDRAKEGKPPVPDVPTHEIIANFPVMFTAATEMDRPVLRIILPDTEGRLTPDVMTGNFALQWADLKKGE